MAARFERAPERLRELMNRVMKQFHGHLDDLELKVDLLLAFGPTDEDGELTGEAITVGGYQAAACVRVVNLRDRTKGMGDAEIQVDGDHWDEWTDRQIMALLDHELSHLEPVFDRDGDVKRDDLERPRLKIALHDRQFGWFDSVARRWGSDSWESMQVRGLVTDWRFTEVYLPGFDPIAEYGRDRPEPEERAEFQLELDDESKAADSLGG
ncbi:putative metallopeptidase [Roseiconus lacunae]|uniref:Metallopeptidase n=1 Tax=Roseiconus lacunae TaxID=2605694 RepID=A0ABT7PEK9_9BACT|nr:putative metallopeptidase [Roseiconus lacunae]MCD0460032.1 hypothetical protein [Roseiconus lacunae]MDM4014938.1 putative metallopeptidase [Roseiconus lacunae]